MFYCRANQTPALAILKLILRAKEDCLRNARFVEKKFLPQNTFGALNLKLVENRNVFQDFPLKIQLSTM